MSIVVWLSPTPSSIWMQKFTITESSSVWITLVAPPRWSPENSPFPKCGPSQTASSHLLHTNGLSPLTLQDFLKSIIDSKPKQAATGFYMSHDSGWAKASLGSRLSFLRNLYAQHKWQPSANCSVTLIRWPWKCTDYGCPWFAALPLGWAYLVACFNQRWNTWGGHSRRAG